MGVEGVSAGERWSRSTHPRSNLLHEPQGLPRPRVRHRGLTHQLYRLPRRQAILVLLALSSEIIDVALQRHERLPFSIWK